MCAGAIPVEGARVCGWGLGQASLPRLSKSLHVREGAGVGGMHAMRQHIAPVGRHRVMDTVARAQGGEGHTPGITLMPHLGDSQGCVKPGVMSPGGDRVLT